MAAGAGAVRDLRPGICMFGQLTVAWGTLALIGSYSRQAETVLGRSRTTACGGPGTAAARCRQ